MARVTHHPSNIFQLVTLSIALHPHPHSSTQTDWSLWAKPSEHNIIGDRNQRVAAQTVKPVQDLGRVRSCNWTPQETVQAH